MNTDHCQPNEDCHCSEKTEKTINELFYANYSDQFEESAGDVTDDGKVTLYYHNPLTGANVKVNLDDNGDLVVENL